MTTLEKSARTVLERLSYHFVNTSGDWNVPNEMPFMLELLNEIRSLCNLCLETTEPNFQPKDTPSPQRTYENIVSSFFYYMWNGWGSKEECHQVFGCLTNHFWEKWCSLFREYRGGAAEMFYAGLSDENRRKLVDRACALYNGVYLASMNTIMDENGIDGDNEHETLYCSECGSTDVQVMAWVNINEGNTFDGYIGDNDDEENNSCKACGLQPHLLTHTELMGQIQAWWEQTDTNTREKITGIHIARFDGGEIPAYESACQAYWDGLSDHQKIEKWNKWKTDDYE